MKDLETRRMAAKVQRRTQVVSAAERKGVRGQLMIEVHRYHRRNENWIEDLVSGLLQKRCNSCWAVRLKL
ncbi:hypothetical protein GUF51_05700, partial [Xanthomonas citri pv. citri]|nr:hypothetical protein [Xanthomonas citri pv. citri]